MKRVIAEEKPLLIGYDETRFTAALSYHEQNPEEELILLEGMRHQLARILKGLPESAWARTCVHSERGLMTLEEMLQAEVDHIPHHIRHINDKRGAWTAQSRTSDIGWLMRLMLRNKIVTTVGGHPHPVWHATAPTIGSARYAGCRGSYCSLLQSMAVFRRVSLPRLAPRGATDDEFFGARLLNNPPPTEAEKMGLDGTLSKGSGPIPQYSTTKYFGDWRRSRRSLEVVWLLMVLSSQLGACRRSRTPNSGCQIASARPKTDRGVPFSSAIACNAHEPRGGPHLAARNSSIYIRCADFQISLTQVLEIGRPRLV